MHAPRKIETGTRTAVAVLWGSPRYGHPHSPNSSDMVIPFSYYLSDLG